MFVYARPRSLLRMSLMPICEVNVNINKVH